MPKKPRKKKEGCIWCIAMKKADTNPSGFKKWFMWLSNVSLYCPECGIERT